MTRLHYISPSLLPSRAANSVHVMLQCEGLADAGAAVTLYAKRTLPQEADMPAALKQAYGIDAHRLNLVTFHSTSTRGDTMRIAGLAVNRILRRPRGEPLLSRNLHAAWVLAVLARRPLLFETHQLEQGMRRTMQRAIMARPWVRTVAISTSLVTCLQEHHDMVLPDPLVLHDAAPGGIERIAPQQRRTVLSELLQTSVTALSRWTAVCAYFGHLYPGRGIEVIVAMAARRPDCLFLVYGGNESDIAAGRAAKHGANLHYMGHVPHPIARRTQAAADVLLMPYQQSVSIGVQGHDTARWMSPMKMFEYLAAGVPVISSDLPVLREVLDDGRNCLLVAPDQADAWVAALDRLLALPSLADSLGERAHAQYRAHHTWVRRAEALLAAARSL